MSNSTPKRGLSGLMSRFRRSGSEESSNSSSAAENSAEDEGKAGEEEAAFESPVSTLALMDETSPEAWLGQFLVMLEIPAGSYHTLAGAAAEQALRARLRTLREEAAAAEPAKLLDLEYAEGLRSRDWAAWYRGQNALGQYAYAVLALALLGEEGWGRDVIALYRQQSNPRIALHAQYVLSRMLGRDWPGYGITEGDLERIGHMPPEG